ncbi:hypothetical protein [Desmospora activa]|uniref:Uncharacterized protein n=1 Tax=Desmospora activa DSM 45169 TaxID=1121389 RepID=A0A2T4Z921_9BACL|nr:hypothetical protein [Desmospora activa]PTM58393.1 hypothetical protein C8J48_0975 [Desmospora activa DSM 45169]
MKKIVVFVMAFSLLVGGSLMPLTESDLVFAQENKLQDCSSCSGNVDESFSNASPEQREEILDIVKGSEQYKNLHKNNAVSFSESTTTEVKISVEHPELGFTLIKNTDERKLSIFGVDLEKDFVFSNVNYDIDKINDNEEILTIKSTKKEQSFKITQDGKLFDLTNNKEIKPEEIEKLWNERGAEGEVNPLATCREYVATMCGLMAGYGMTQLCAMSFFAGGLPGVGCVVVYAAIATWGCGGAIDLFC